MRLKNEAIAIFNFGIKVSSIIMLIRLNPFVRAFQTKTSVVSGQFFLNLTMIILVRRREKDAVRRQRGLFPVQDVKNGIRSRHMYRMQRCSVTYKGMTSDMNVIIWSMVI